VDEREACHVYYPTSDAPSALSKLDIEEFGYFGGLVKIRFVELTNAGQEDAMRKFGMVFNDFACQLSPGHWIGSVKIADYTSLK
jgi:hypothetical protein